MQQPKAAAYIQQAMRVVAALPLQRRAADTPGRFGAQHASAALLLGHVCSAELPDSTAAAAVWPFVEAVPRLAALLAALAADDSTPVNQLSVLCYGLRLTAGALLHQLPTLSGNSRLAAWAAAGDASLRLVPVLLQLHERCRSVSGEHLQQAPLHLSQNLLCVVDAAGLAAMHVAEKVRAAQPPAADEQLTRQLWSLHTSMCRLVAWLAADPTGARAAVLPLATLQGAALPLHWLSALRYMAMEEGMCASDEGLLR